MGRKPPPPPPPPREPWIERVDLGLPERVMAQTYSKLTYHLPRNDDYVLPPYQREHVWKPEQAVKLLNNILRGIPIGTIILWDVWAGPVVVVDGQQRLTAMNAAIKRHDGTMNTPHPEVVFDVDAGRFTCEPTDAPTFTPAEMFDYRNYDNVASLDTARRRGVYVEAFDRIRQHQTPTVQLQRATAAQVAEVFVELNRSGTPMTEAEMRMAMEECERLWGRSAWVAG